MQYEMICFHNFYTLQIMFRTDCIIGAEDPTNGRISSIIELAWRMTVVRITLYALSGNCRGYLGDALQIIEIVDSIQ